MSCINWEGIKYKLRRCCGLTDYDRARKKRQVNNTKLSMQEDLISSLRIDPLRDLPVRISIRLAYCIYFILFCAMAIFFLQGFRTVNNEKFLALSNSAGVCKEVPKQVSGIYGVDIFGNWEGSATFEVSKSIYELTLNRIELTQQGFVNLIKLGLSELEKQAELSVNWPLADNLVFWVSWSINTVESANKQHFRLTGDAKTLFNQGTTRLAGMSTLSGRCNASTTVSYEKASGVFRVKYSYAEFMSSESCTNAGDPRNMGFIPGINTDEFVLEFDMQSVMTCIGVNYGIIDYEVLQEVPYTRSTVVLNGQEETYALYYNPRYPNMNAITCFANKNSSSIEFEYDRITVCAYQIGATPFYPVYNHIGYRGELNETKYCSCSDEVFSNDKISEECNAFLLMTGFVFYNAEFDEMGTATIESLENFLILLENYPGGEDRLYPLNRDAYNISKDALDVSNNVYVMNHVSRREQAYDFCSRNTTRPCSILTVFSGSSENKGISEDYYQLPTAHCRDTISTPEESQAKMLVPPVPLTENYLECHRTWLDSVISSAGIAVGNVLSVKSALILLFTFWLGRYTKKNDSGQQKLDYVTYGMIERDKVLQYLAFNLLLARDGKYCRASFGSDQGLEANEDSLVMKLAEELQVHPGLRKFFPKDGEEEKISEEANPLGDAGVEMSSKSNLDADKSAPMSQDGKSKMPSSISVIYNIPKDVKQRSVSAFKEEVLHNPMYHEKKNK